MRGSSDPRILLLPPSEVLGLIDVERPGRILDNAYIEPKSSGSEQTFAQDLTNADEIREEVTAMAREAAAWLAKRDLYARTVTLKVRYSDFTTITRSHTEQAGRDEENLVTRACALIGKTESTFENSQ